MQLLLFYVCLVKFDLKIELVNNLSDLAIC